MTALWSCVNDAHHRAEPRIPLRLWGQPVGSVAQAHADVLRRWPEALAVAPCAVDWVAAPPALDALWAQINTALRDAGLIVAWRNETYPVLPEGARAGDPPLALIERAASRFWGTLTFGAHCNGYVADGDGLPTHLWIARRARTKATDPGKLDNLVGGGVPHGQTPFEALVREGFEEAGLSPTQMHAATPGSVLHLQCDIAKGFMNEHLHTFDLRLDAQTTPANQDGEVDAWYCMTINDALVRAARGEMTVDAALVTLDFALRHALLDAQQADTLRPRLKFLLRA
jgi:8-oxo-dGTP pyrophosphatase MutT (NUDIX family)